MSNVCPVTNVCPACQGTALEDLVRVERSPVMTGVLWPSREAAMTAQRRALELSLCAECGTVVNVAFEAGLVEYGGEYDNSLHFSPAFRAYAEALADRLIVRHNLVGREVVEIGSGKGDFLRLLCARGLCAGTGYDPTYIGPERADDAAVTFVVDLYGSRYSHLPADLVVCRHVLEHVSDPLGFLTDIRNALGGRDASLYLEVPNGGFVLGEAGVWDFIYPHVSYFSPAGLRRVVSAAGFTITDAGTSYGDQFLWIEAKTAPTTRPSGRIGPAAGEDVVATDRFVVQARKFGDVYREVVGRWSAHLADLATDADSAWDAPRALVWGAGSKGVAFLNVLDVGSAVRGVVDLNPRKRGLFVPGTGHPVLAPEDLSVERVGRVFLPNPLYLDEVRGRLAELGVPAEVVPLSS
ncbi:class I SAM-dependent methyltransferase [Frankia sp. B2]|uniref:class I SAM-dependent methyltransferase n=1 Tax=Frankia sp. B2 TaxID=2541730 RepID=UPI001F114671|nr:class I SAM-dependent methyltransferase [Frankia sp. B2]